MGKITLGYWNIRGLAEPARMLLEYGDLDYENKTFQTGGPPDYEKSSWLDAKFKLGLDFPNLPYLIDGDIKITESVAIYRYIAKKVGLVPTDAKALAICEMMESVVNKTRGDFSSPCYSSDFEKLKPKIKDAAIDRFATYEKFLTGRKFVAGDKLSYVDFMFYETLDHHRLLFPDILDKFPNIKSFMERFASLDRIAAYFKSNRYHRFPVNNPVAKWGTQKE